MNKEIRLIAKNVTPIEPLEAIAPGPQEKTIRLTATNVFPIAELTKMLYSEPSMRVGTFTRGRELFRENGDG